MSNFPESLDTDQNLYLVHDALRVRLAENYSPGDTSITVDADPTSTFPPTGIITLTEQCSQFDSRAISFSYSGMTSDSFTGLELLSNFTDMAKPKRITYVTMNVMAEHHEALKDALINIEHMAGKKGEAATIPLTGTMEQRINYLRNLVLKPKAWFSADRTTDVVPMTVNFTDLSLRAPTTYVWDFGDGDTETLTFPYVPGEAEGTSSSVPDGSVSHTYSTPDKYDVTLTVTNPFGTSTITFEELINARTIAPDEATITFNPSAVQTYTSGVLRSRIGLPIDILITDTGEQASDPIVNYSWTLGDDLLHPSALSTEAQYSVGGQYDVILRTTTTLGAYRITTFPEVIDVIESTNLWLSVFDPDAGDDDITKDTFTYEFGLFSEVFKTKTYNALSVTRDYTFLVGLDNDAQQIREFRRNNGFTPRTSVASGDHGAGVMYWQEDQTTVRAAEFNGFTDTYTFPTIDGDNSFTRPWNWVSFNSPEYVYFLFGNQDPTVDSTNPVVDILELSSYNLDSFTLTGLDFEDGADELLTNVQTTTDQFSVYRSCWKDNVGYIVRNDGMGAYFRLKSFYQTEGVPLDPIQQIRKLTDVPGDKPEGQIVGLTGGIYFFNNSGNTSVYNTTTETWETYGAGSGSPLFSSLQDSTVSGFDSISNTLLAVSDGERTAYLSFDYSNKTFIKFNEVDATFTRLVDRPEGEQFMTAIY